MPGDLSHKLGVSRREGIDRSRLDSRVARLEIVQHHDKCVQQAANGRAIAVCAPTKVACDGNLHSCDFEKIAGGFVIHSKFSVGCLATPTRRRPAVPVKLAGGVMPTSHLTTSFALGSSQPLADRREGLSPSDPSRHPLQKSPRQGAVQGRRPVVAGRTRFAGQDPVPARAGHVIHHRQIPTWNAATRDDHKVNSIWVSVSEN